MDFFLLINTAVAKEHEVHNEVKKVAKVTEAMMLFGEYDVIVQCLEADADEVLRAIRTIHGVTDVKVLACRGPE